MGKRLKNPREKIMQRSVGFPMRVHEFLAKYPDFSLDTYARKIVDEQIKQIDPTFLSGEEIEAIEAIKGFAEVEHE